MTAPDPESVLADELAEADAPPPFAEPQAEAPPEAALPELVPDPIADPPWEPALVVIADPDSPPDSAPLIEAEPAPQPETFLMAEPESEPVSAPAPLLHEILVAAPRASPLPAPVRNKRLLSAVEALTKNPERFKFDAAVRILLAASPDPEDDDRLRFAATASLAQPAAEITSAQAPATGVRARLTTPLIGLTGASGVMPRWYTELIAQSVRAKSRAIADFFDLLAQRLITGFAQAGTKYRLHRSAETADHTGTDEPIGASLLALTGYATGHLSERLTAGGPDLLRHYSGFFVRPRSTDRLRNMAADYLGRDVDIIEFDGAWLNVPPDGQSRMPKGRVPGAFNELGVNCAIGTRAWDQQARFIVRVGPLKRDEFESLLPDKQGLKELVSLVRAYVGWECDFAVNLVLAADEVPSMQMAGGNAQNAPRLGWTSWMPSTTSKLTGSKNVDEAIFGATLVESMS